MSTPSSDRAALGSIGGHISWANTVDRSARTAPGRAALAKKFLDQAGGDPVRAEHLRKAHFKRLALKSAQARRRKTGGGSAPPGGQAETSTTGRPADNRVSKSGGVSNAAG